VQTVEVWLVKTGWGSTNTLASVNKDIDLEEVTGFRRAEGLKGSKDNKGSGDSEDEVSDDDDTMAT